MDGNSLIVIVIRIRKFRTDRDWEQFHTQANLSKEISIETEEFWKNSHGMKIIRIRNTF